MSLTNLSFTNFWKTPPIDLPLPDDQVHVWCARLNLPRITVKRLRSILTEEESLRAKRYRFPEHRRHFTVARATLRMLLGRYLRRSPEKIDLVYNQHGKPFLDGSLRFNLSHSGEMVLYAFTQNREVGIDIEWMQRRIGDSRQIVKRFFSPREIETFLGLPAPLQKEAFFNCWTCKEAYGKARGKGLLIPLDEIEVMQESGIPACLVTTHDDLQNKTHWTVETLPPKNDYIATLVVEGHRCEVRYWRMGLHD